MAVVPDSFLQPGRLFGLLAIVVLGVTYMVMGRRRLRYAVRFTNVELLDKVAPTGPGWRRHVPAVCFLVGLAAMVVAWARPVQSAEVPSEQAAIVLAIDTSLSMQATDVDPTRLDSAKAAAVSFIEDLPDRIRIGIISFNGVATIRVLPTHNHAAAAAAVEALELGPATAIGEAIFAGLDALEQTAADEDGQLPPARIVVMSDGETTVGRSDEEAVAAAQQTAVPVSTIAFGTDGGFIQLPDEPRPIAVPVNEESLRSIAESTGGDFYTARTTDELDRVYENIGSRVTFEKVDDEIGQTYLTTALIAMAMASTASLAWFSRLP